MSHMHVPKGLVLITTTTAISQLHVPLQAQKIQINQ